jgi:hypothetical protein|uniref:hypothetical protein n=1 Tax=Flavobacterium sp. TaxID=239 RepID=UPI004049480F
MEKCLFSKESDDAISEFRASNFRPIPDYKAVISDFDKMYESYQNLPVLFTVIGSDEIVLIAEVSQLNFIIDGVFDSWEVYGDVFELKIEEVKDYLKNNDISELSVNIICEMIKNESYSLDVLVQMIALPGQTITIQNSNITYGNTEFEITS